MLNVHHYSASNQHAKYIVVSTKTNKGVILLTAADALHTNKQISQEIWRYGFVSPHVGDYICAYKGFKTTCPEFFI